MGTDRPGRHRATRAEGDPMSYVRCQHKTQADHSRRVGDLLHWTCSGCGTVGPWTEAWGYYGTIECKRCWMAAIEWVHCSEACRLALAAKHVPEDKPRANRQPVARPEKPRPAWERKAIAAGWTAPLKADPEAKNADAVALGRRGGLKGGKARAAKMTAEQRSAAAKKAAEARWQSPVTPSAAE